MENWLLTLFLLIGLPTLFLIGKYMEVGIHLIFSIEIV